MLKKMRDLLRDEQGFTLVELMVVIVILGILAGIGIPTYNNFVKRAQKAELEVAARTLRLGLQLYKMEKQDYPIKKLPSGEGTLIRLTDIFGKDQDFIDDADWPDNVTISSYSYETGQPTFKLTHDTNNEVTLTYPEQEGSDTEGTN